MLRTVGLVARFDREKAVRLAEDLAEHLRAKGLEVLVEDTLVGKMKTEAKAVALGRMKADLIITVGGDGTILRTCVAVPKPEPPILAVNMGVRGFLTEVEPKDALEAVDKCIGGEFKIEKCMKLAVKADGLQFPDALNEVAIRAEEPAKLLYACILKDKEEILRCQSDGLMVSTQTGSTGYSLSAGGPVLDPAVDAFVLTPICAVSALRPIVFPADSTLEIRVDRPKEVLVLIDGQHRQLVKSRSPSLTVTCSKNVTSFVRFKPDFYHRLRSRLLFKGIG